MTVKEWLAHTFKEVPYGLLVREHAVCEDGFTISIQASKVHYCCPKDTIASGDYTHAELGYSCQREELLEPFKAGNIYPYVPIEVAEKVIENHGGIIDEM